MKPLIIFAAWALCIAFLFGLSSCFVMVSKDNGKHKGWNKNPNNPHHPHTTNPGKAKGRGNK